MLTRTNLIQILSIVTFSLTYQLNLFALKADSIALYTPYTKISVPPGESIDYTVDIINNSNKMETVDIIISGLPKSWNYTLKSGGWSISQMSVLPGERKNFNLHVEVPVKINKGNYPFKVIARGFCTLPLSINVSKQGTFKTEFTTKQANMQGQANANFTFSADLKNQTAGKQLYALLAETAPGWIVTFKANYNQVTSVEIEPNNSANITIDVNPPDNIEAGTYNVPVKAVTDGSSANLTLQVVITGSYNMELTTPTGLLSTSITAGETKQIELQLKNTGSSELTNINFSPTKPNNWEVSFEPKTIERLPAGSQTQIFATVKADKKAIPGDYAIYFEARCAESSSKASFRAVVKTSMFWGWVGIAIIAFAIGTVFYLFRKYGRR